MICSATSHWSSWTHQSRLLRHRRREPWAYGHSKDHRPDLKLGFVLFGLARGNGLFEIFESQVELIGIELLRMPAEVHALQLANQLAQSVVLTSQLIAFFVSRAFSASSASRSGGLSGISCAAGG